MAFRESVMPSPSVTARVNLGSRLTHNRKYGPYSLNVYLRFGDEETVGSGYLSRWWRAREPDVPNRGQCIFGET